MKVSIGFRLSTEIIDLHASVKSCFVWAPIDLSNSVESISWIIEGLKGSVLSHCGRVMPYGDTELGQLWLR